MTITFSTRPLKALLVWMGVYLFRLVPFRPGNFEPMLAALMPLGKRFGFLTSFFFGFLGIVLFDAVTSGFGIWTFVTATCYGLLGVGAHFFFKNRAGSRANFLTFGIIGTLLYDAATGLTVGPIFFDQPFMQAVIGQLPFTLMHLLSTVLFTLSLSPALDRWFARSEVVCVRLSLTRFPVLVTVSE